MGNIVIIGPRGSGKTTFLAGLAYWPKLKTKIKQKTQLNVTPVNEDTKKLQNMAEDLISEGESLEATKIPTHKNLPVFNFYIELNQRLKKEPEIINLVVKDYPGEIFDDLADYLSQQEFHYGIRPKHEEFWQDCFLPDNLGCLILLTKWWGKVDREYGKSLEAFINLMDEKQRTKDFRVAVAMSKCERGELWPGRLEPDRDIFQRHLPYTKSILEKNIPKKNLCFYAISTFGVLGDNDPRPNRINSGTKSLEMAVLREKNKWQPYNAIAPLYWLTTGKKIGANVQ